eukprot:3941538-Rhodomonas_salina.9
MPSRSESTHRVSCGSRHPDSDCKRPRGVSAGTRRGSADVGDATARGSGAGERGCESGECGGWRATVFATNDSRERALRARHGCRSASNKQHRSASMLIRHWCGLSGVLTCLGAARSLGAACWRESRRVGGDPGRGWGGGRRGVVDPLHEPPGPRARRSRCPPPLRHAGRDGREGRDGHGGVGVGRERRGVEGGGGGDDGGGAREAASVGAGGGGGSTVRALLLVMRCRVLKEAVLLSGDRARGGGGACLPLPLALLPRLPLPLLRRLSLAALSHRPRPQPPTHQLPETLRAAERYVRQRAARGGVDVGRRR